MNIEPQTRCAENENGKNTRARGDTRVAPSLVSKMAVSCQCVDEERADSTGRTRGHDGRVGTSGTLVPRALLSLHLSHCLFSIRIIKPDKLTLVRPKT